MAINEDIEAAIAAAFSQLAYPVVKAEQLEAAREFVKGQDVFVSIRLVVESRYATDDGLQGFRSSTVAILNARAARLSS